MSLFLLLIFGPVAILLPLYVWRSKWSLWNPLYHGIWAARIAAPVLGVAAVILVLRNPSSTAALGLLGVPFMALAGAVLCFLIVWSASAVILPASRRHLRLTRYGWAQWPIALAILGFMIWQGSAIAYSEYFVLKAKSSDSKILWEVFNHPEAKGDPFVLAALAKNEHSPPDLLLALANIDNPTLHDKRSGYRNLIINDYLAVMRHLVRNKNTSVEALEILSDSHNHYVLSDVARDPRTPEETLKRLNANKSYLVEWGLAANPNTPPKILEDLLRGQARSDNEYTRHGVARNSHTPPDVLTELSKDPNMFVRRYVASNKSTPVETLRQLLNDPEGEVRFYLSINPSAPDDLLEALLTDADERARKTARSKLKHRDILRRGAQG